MSEHKVFSEIFRIFAKNFNKILVNIQKYEL